MTAHVQPLVSYFFPFFRKLIEYRHKRPASAFDMLQKLDDSLAEAKGAARQAKWHEQDILESAFAAAALADEVTEEAFKSEGGAAGVEKLQDRLYDTTNAGEEFFIRLDALTEERADVREVYLTALTLGFKGKIDLPGGDRSQITDLIRAHAGRIPRLSVRDLPSPRYLTPQPYEAIANAAKRYPPDLRPWAAAAALLTAALIGAGAWYFWPVSNEQVKAATEALFTDNNCRDVKVAADDSQVTVTGHYPWKKRKTDTKDEKDDLIKTVEEELIRKKLLGVRSVNVQGFTPTRTKECIQDDVNKTFPSDKECFTASGTYDEKKGSVKATGALESDAMLKETVDKLRKIKEVRDVDVTTLKAERAPSCVVRDVEKHIPQDRECSYLFADVREREVELKGLDYDRSYKDELLTKLRAVPGVSGLSDKTQMLELKIHACAAALLAPYADEYSEHAAQKIVAAAQAAAKATPSAFAAGNVAALQAFVPSPNRAKFITVTTDRPSVCSPLTATLNTQEGGYFYMDLFGNQGNGANVAHVMPGEDFRDTHYGPNRTERVGSEQGWTFDPPAGEHLLTVIASSVKLDDDLILLGADAAKRPSVENAEDYVRRLRQALQKAKDAGATIRTQILRVTTQGSNAECVSLEEKETQQQP